MGQRRWSGIESQLRAVHGERIAGVDEVGRGPLAGPVVACAVIMPSPGERRAIPGIDDSKRLSEAERERLADLIRAEALAIGVGAASVREIDTINIYQATALAMRRALRRLAIRPDHVLVDGKPIRTLGIPHTAVVKGDSSCYSIACASIIAKTLRDDLMARLSVRYPAYGWEQNAGYPTPRHIEVIDERGITPHHRVSFRVKQFELAID